jgi:multidrug efflux pump subunit AcrB
LDEIANTLVYSVQGKSISLKDIAHVHLDFDESKHITSSMDTDPFSLLLH